MSEGHYCSIHNMVFFKKGGMRGYAHPIQGENGMDTGKWCNEKDLEKVKNLPPEDSQKLLPKDQKIIDGEIKTRPAPQELGMWWKELGEMLRAKDIDLTKPAGKAMRTAYYAQMLSVLDIKIGDK